MRYFLIVAAIGVVGCSADVEYRNVSARDSNAIQEGQSATYADPPGYLGEGFPAADFAEPAGGRLED